MHLTLTASIVALAFLTAAAPQHLGQGAGLAIPITKRTFDLLKADQSVDFVALDSHVASAEARIHCGFANYERNTGFMHPAAVNGIQKRDDFGGAPVPLIDAHNEHWYGTISVGTPPRQFTVAFSTSSGDLVIPASTCKSTCNDHTLWDPTSSSTAKDQGHTFNITYKDGSYALGEIYTDTVTIASFTATTQTLGAATTYSPGLQGPKFPSDGVMGMGYPSISAYHANPVMQTLIAEGQAYPVFGLMLSNSGGELFIGGTNDTLWYGEIGYASVLTQGYWEVYMEYILVGEQSYGANIDCIIDTSTTLIVGIPSEVADFYSTIGGTAAPSYGAGYYTFPCDSFPSISLAFGNVELEISTSAINLGPVSPGSPNCVSGIVAGQDPNASYWIIGDIFLRSVYTMFDLVNNQIGFAHLK